MAKRRIKPGVKKGLFGFIVFVIILIIALYFLYEWGLKPVTNVNTPVEITIDSGETYLTIGKTLKEKGLIHSELVYKIYVKLNKPTNFRAGTFSLNKNMGVKKLVDTLATDPTATHDTITITFPEGKNMRQVAKIISDKTNNTEEEIFALLQDEEYLKELIEKYWFLDETILDEKIYYSLEGYLFPDTYEFMNTNVTGKEIFEKMLDHMEVKLEPYKSEIESSEYTLHEMLTLASIIELEASNADDRAGVAGVFYNRLEDGWSLGSDVTTYYAAKVDLSERDLYQSEIDDVNDYNTRTVAMAGKLPIGPICNPSIMSIKAAIKPTEHNNYFFVADKNGKTYFSKTNSEHINTVNTLKKEGLWFEY